MNNNEHTYFFEVGSTDTYIVNKMWDKPIELLGRSALSQNDIEKLLYLAESWHTDICSCIDVKIKKRYNGIPIDEQLQKLGIEFAKCWDIANEYSCSHKFISDRLKKIIQRIEFRCAKILFSSDVNYNTDIGIEYNSKNHRYYATIKNKYLKMRKSNGVIELLEPEMKSYADGFKSNQGAKELLTKYNNQFNC